MKNFAVKIGVMIMVGAALDSLPIASATSDTPLYLQNKTYQLQVENQSHYKQHHADIVMLGDSITFNVQWNELLGRNAANRGIGGDYTAGMLERLNYVTNLTPYMVFIMAGVNDMLKDNIPPEAAFRNYKQIINLLEARHITPVITYTLYVGKEVGRHQQINGRIKQLNTMLSIYVNQHHIRAIDLNPILAPDGYLISRYTIDGIHITGDAYDIWGQKINKAIEQYNSQHKGDD